MAATAILRRAVARKFLNIAKNYSSKTHDPLHHVDPVQAEKAEKMWRILSFTVVPVALGLGFLNVYLIGDEGDPPEFIPYEHLRIRTKRFPWGDGNHTFFHNPHANALPNGYEHV